MESEGGLLSQDGLDVPSQEQAMAAAIQDQIDRKTHGKVLIGGTAVITAAGLSPVALAAARGCLSKPASCDAILTGVVDAVASEATGGASLVVGAGAAAKTAELIVENVARKGASVAAKPAAELKSDLGAVWNLKPTQRGVEIESYLAKTEYSSQGGWYNIGASKNGYFPLADFQNGSTLVSLKSVDTSGSSWLSRMQDHIVDLGSNGATVNGAPAQMVLICEFSLGGAYGCAVAYQFWR